MKRREFMALAGWFIACPQLVSGQSSERKRRIGLLSPFSEQDNETQARLAAFKQLLDKLGWIEGRNIQIDLRFSARFETKPLSIGAETCVNTIGMVRVNGFNAETAGLATAIRNAQSQREILPASTVLSLRWAGSGWSC